MTKADKLISKLLAKPKDLTFAELVSIFGSFGFQIESKGKTSGSRVEFYNEELDISFYTHKPHPSSIVKTYVIKEVINFLRERNLL